ncbi:hypothetical protein [Nocardia jinanensis]|uniref:Signal transduction histidine kinase n=1 Tax=Nocardia jinanensis TaxID=382504 RepID=A0A917VMA6_9NOCA|nr:hypothetical protein [Nocardia jinanensis]GGK95562.1 hypothetical protein GCM10011588_07420 [Nocardia jinanensis]
MSEPDSDTELRALLGMRGPGGWFFLTGLVMIITLHMIPTFGIVPAEQAGTAFAAMLGAGAIVLLVAGDPLPWPATVTVLLAGLTAVVLTSLNSYEGAVREPWAAFAFSFVLAVLPLRSRIGAAWAGAAAVAVALAAADIALDVDFGSLFVPIVALATLAGASVCALILRPTQRSLRLLHEDAAMRAAAEATMAAEHSERIRQLARLDRVARPMLERIARGADLSAAEREKCRLLEAELRDSLRAPQLVTDRLNSAARGARSRGAEVLLLDDGGFAEVPGAVRDLVVQFAIRALDAADGGAVTVRVLPAGRRNIATVLVSGTDGDRRTDIGRSGEVSVFE